MPKYTIFIFLFFVSVCVIFKIIFSTDLIGRSLDFSVPPVSYLMKNVLLNTFYTWQSNLNGGARNTFTPTLLPVNIILYSPTLIGINSPWFIARFQLVLTLFISMISFYFLSQKLIQLSRLSISQIQKISISIAASLFFTLNNYFFCELIFGSNVMYFTFGLTPLLIYSILQYFESKNRSYFAFTLLLIVIISSTLQHLVLAYIFFFLLALIYKEKSSFLKIALLHFLISLYWIIPLFYFIPEVSTSEIKGSYNSGLITSSTNFLMAFINGDYFGNRDLYRLSLNNITLQVIWTFNAFLLIIISFTSLIKISSFNRISRQLIATSSLILIISIFFIKGGKYPLGFITLSLYKWFPLLNLYRSLQHYMSYYVIAVSCLFVFSCIYLVRKNGRYIWIILLLVLINALPWILTGDLGIKNIAPTKIVSLGLFSLTEGNKKLYNLNNQSLDFGIMTVPAGLSINFLPTYANSIKTQGVDAGLLYGNKKFYANEFYMDDFTPTLQTLEKDMYMNPTFIDDNSNLLALLHIKYFILRKDTSPDFSKYRLLFNFTAAEQFNKTNTSVRLVSKDDYITILENRHFLPMVYTPQKILISDSVASLPFLFQKLSTPRTSILFSQKNKTQTDILNIIIKDGPLKTPYIEYRKINPTKYRIIVHRMKQPFLLTIGESFHQGWNLFFSKTYPFTQHQSISLENYRVSEIDKNDQASKDELSQLINKDLVTLLPNTPIKFVSHLYEDSLQNNNLKSGSFFETLSQVSIDNRYHFKVNGYANGWLVNPKEICSSYKNSEGTGPCKINKDGSYDAEFVMNFLPQIYFYIGAIISISTLTFFVSWYLFSLRYGKR